METRIKTTDFEMTVEVQATLDKALEAIQKLVSADMGAARCEVELGRASGMHKSDYMWKAEMQVVFPGGEIFRATNHAPTMNAAIDDVRDEVVRQLRQRKRKYLAVIRRTGKAVKDFLRFGA